MKSFWKKQNLLNIISNVVCWRGVQSYIWFFIICKQRPNLTHQRPLKIMRENSVWWVQCFQLYSIIIRLFFCIILCMFKSRTACLYVEEGLLISIIRHRWHYLLLSMHSGWRSWIKRHLMFNWPLWTNLNLQKPLYIQ